MYKTTLDAKYTIILMLEKVDFLKVIGYAGIPHCSEGRTNGSKMEFAIKIR